MVVCNAIKNALDAVKASKEISKAYVELISKFTRVGTSATEALAESAKNLVKAHEVQLVNYLNALKLEIGLLINFGPSGVDVKRKYRQNERSN